MANPQPAGTNFDNFYEEIEQPELIREYLTEAYPPEEPSENMAGLSEDDLKYLVEDQRSGLSEVTE